MSQNNLDIGVFCDIPTYTFSAGESTLLNQAGSPLSGIYTPLIPNHEPSSFDIETEPEEGSDAPRAPP